MEPHHSISKVTALIGAEYGEPPPTAQEREWIDAITSEILENDEVAKPIVATLQSENNLAPIQTLHESLPLQYQDNNGIRMDTNDMFIDVTNDPNNDDNELIYGKIATGYDMEKDCNNDINPMVDAMRESIKQTKTVRKLTPIAEENEWDMKIDSKPKAYVISAPSRKKLLGRTRRYQSKQAKINEIMKKGNGIYRGSLKMQDDGGANRSVTNQKELLIHYKDIKPYGIGGVKKGEAAIYCTGEGYIPWYSDDDELFLVKCYYCEQVAGTILSPNDLAHQYSERFYGWNFNANMKAGVGQLSLLADDGQHALFSAYKENNLWFHYLEQPNNAKVQRMEDKQQAIIKSLSAGAQYELWHNRLGHPGEKVMSIIHNHAKGVPKLSKPSFHKCAACMASKFKKQPIGQARNSHAPTSTPSEEPCKPGQHLHMDFGFVRGSDWKAKDNDGKLITSIDKYRSYLLIIDRATRYIWIFLTKTKEPPIEQAKGILQRFQNQFKYCTVTTDLGKELGKSAAFQRMISNTNYVLKTTGAYSSAQNGMAEKPNQDLARMTRSLLYGAGLGSQYWSYALRHAVYLKNRLPHASKGWKSPYECINGIQPDLSKLKIFGSRVLVHDGKRKAKLDDISSVGTFLTYKGTNKIMYVRDRKSNEERVATHAVFDEAFMGEHNIPLPPMATALQKAGIKKQKQSSSNITTTSVPQLQVKLLTPKATMPHRATATAAGLDMYSAQSVTIPSKQQVKISTAVAMAIPAHLSGQLQIRSSLALKHQLELKAGLIDSDYRGEIFIILYNNNTEDYKINEGDRIAQMVLHEVPEVELVHSEELDSTDRNEGGFGSTGKSAVINCNAMPTNKPSGIPTVNTMDTIHPVYNVCLSDDPYVDKINIDINNKGHHPTLGLQLQNSTEWNDTVNIIDCTRATPAVRIHRWRTRVKGNTLLQVNGIQVNTVEDVKNIIQQYTSNKTHTLTIGLREKVSMHDDDGVPMLYFDQLAMIAKHLNNIKYDIHDNESVENPEQYQEEAKEKVLVNMMKAFISQGTINAAKAAIPKAIIPKGKQRASKLTRRKLKKRDDWLKWRESEFKQLDQYEEQRTFGKPCELPIGANVLDLLWAYTIKDDGRLKARCVCNGKPSNKNTAIFGYTYAKALDQVGAKIFWASAAAKNMIVRGADASNAFAEADAPKIPLYVRIDQQYREWYANKYPAKPPLPDNHVLPVLKALQGHPESPRSWATLINNILTTKLHFKPTSHEPCLYHGSFNGKEILFLRQVDDFAVAAHEETTAIAVIKAINEEMTIEVKDLGRLDRYNGVDVTQSKHFVKLSNATYIHKIREGHHSWLQHQKPLSAKPIPMHSDTSYIRQLEEAIPPVTEEEQRKLQLSMGINYRQAIGELIYAMISCRPDISFPLIKLSQYSNKPAKIHYEAVKHLLQYLFETPHEGLYYWRSEEHEQLPPLPFPETTQQNYTPSQDSQPDSTTTMHAAVDADWAGDTTHRKSVTGITLRLAGGTILYKSKYQQTIATSSTEAEFTAACDAGKAILYVRSILDEINLPQHAATTLFIDNNGALMMGNAQQPTRRTRHMDIKKFVLIDWIEHDLLLMKRITTNDNYSNTMTKQVGRVLHYRHFDYILGKIKPRYTRFQMSASPLGTIHRCSYEHGGDMIHKGDAVHTIK